MQLLTQLRSQSQNSQSLEHILQPGRFKSVRDGDFSGRGILAAPKRIYETFTWSIDAWSCRIWVFSNITATF